MLSTLGAIIRLSIIAILLFWALFVLIRPLAAEEHVHGKNVPDWYDPWCCDNKDCKPVDAEGDIEPFQLNGGGEVAFRHKPTGAVFAKSLGSRFHTSQDERWHVCIYNGQPRCIYIPGGS